MDYDKELERAIKESNIDIYERKIQKEFDIDNNNINKLIIEIWKKTSAKKVAIATAGLTTTEVLKILDGNLDNLVCIIDKYNNGYKLNGYDVISYDDIDKYDIEIVFNPSIGNTKEIKEELGRLIKNCRFVTLKDELKVRGCDFIENYINESLNYKYLKLNYVYVKYNELKSEKYLTSLIYNYLKIRDIYNALKFINLYINKSYNNIINIINLKKQIENIVYCIKEDFCKKNKEYNTKFIFICDSLRYKDVFKLGKMDKLKKRAERGIIIKNAFTHVPYTTGSLLTLFTGKKYLDDGIYNISTLPDNIEIFKEVDRLNYDFKYLGCRTRLFSNKYSINNTNTNMSQIMWLGLCNALKSQKNTLYCLHFMESHSPYFSGKNRKKLVEIAPYWLTNVDDAKIEEEQNIDSLKYMDEQIDFFMNLIGDESQVILFSDHGSIIQNDKITNQDNFYCDDYIRIPYVILNSPLNYLYNNFFSHLDTKNLIINFIRNKNLFDGIDTRKYIEVNRDFTYNDHFLNVTKQNGKLDLGRAFKCFRNQNYKLIKFYDGTKKYYNVPEEKELEGSSIEKFKEIESKFNLNFPKWDSEKYKIAKKFYNIGE